MNGKEPDRLKAGPTALVLIGSLTCLLSGCMGLHLGPGDGQRAESPPTQPTAPAETLSGKDQAMLARVEAYIERTRDYELADAVPAAPARESVPPAAWVNPSFRGDARSSSPAESARNEWPSGTDAPVLPSGDGAFANEQVTLPEVTPRPPAPALPVVQAVSIRVGAGVEFPPAAPVKTTAANEPLTAVAADEPLSLDRFVARLESVSANERDFDAEWRLRLLQLALGRDEQAIRVSSLLAPAARRILSAVAEAVAAARAVARNPAGAEPGAVERAEALRKVLAEQADPVVTEVALCRQVVTFGVYDEMAPEDFLAGRTVQTIVYCEIRNFRSEQTDSGRFKTVLAARLEVLTEDGRSMWQHEEREIVDLCRRPRTDFFLAQRITVPPTLPVGDYVLKVLVEDKLSGRANEAIHRFTIIAPTSVAVGG